jgi:hypothetical protein
MIEMVAKHTVRVTGCHHGTYPLAWGQRWVFEFLDEMEEPGTWLNVRKHGPVPGDPSTADVLRAIGSVVERHDALRTRIHGGAGAGRVQSVAAEGELEVCQYAATSPAVDTLAGDLQETLAADPFGEDELPIRVALITIGDLVHSVVLLLHAPCADAAAAAIVYDEIRRLSRDPELTLPPVWQQRDIVGHETGAAGIRDADRADSYQRRTLRVAPPVPAAATDADDVPYLWLNLHSEAVAAASVELARRYAVTEFSVIFAGYAVALGRWQQRDGYLFWLCSANRDDPRMRRSVARLFQSVPVTVEPVTGSFRSICRNVAAVSLRAHRNGRYDPERLTRTLREIQAARGVELDIPYTVNFRSVGWGDFGGDLSSEMSARLHRHAGADAGKLRGLVDLTRVEQNILRATSPLREIHFAVNELSDVATLQLLSDATAIAPSGPLWILKNIESLLVAAAGDDRDPDVGELTAGWSAAPPPG